ncbi:MAG: succinate dehydrogenase, cytochrome b556 subunit [Anaerolineae bacterium]
MNEKSNLPAPRKFLSWFNPIGRQTGGWAFILNRITALGLTLFLYIHLLVLGKLAQGPNTYDDFVRLTHQPLFIFGELLVVAAAFLHGWNGVRILLTTFGISVPYQKQLFYAFMALAAIAIVIFGYHMFAS